MILAKIHHYLTAEGLTYFPSWFDELYPIIKAKDGFLEIASRIDQSNTCAVILVLFSSKETLTQWTKSQPHHAIIEKLNSYRTQPLISKRYKLCKEIV